MDTAWKDQVTALITPDLADRFLAFLPPGYDDETNPNTAAADIRILAKLNADHPLEIDLYHQAHDTDYPTHLRLYQFNAPIALSDILPILENFGFRVENEQPYKFACKNHLNFYFYDFAVIPNDPTLDVEAVKALFKEAFLALQRDHLLENDALNQLILGGQIPWKDIIILRAYTNYLKQTLFRLSQQSIIKPLVNHTDITKDLISLFRGLHQPKDNDAYLAKTILDHIAQSLDAVTSLDEDRVIRRFTDLIQATLRTNVYQTNASSIVAFKFNSANVPDLPLPLPLYETYVYSPQFEAIHLRNTKVARGGIRWSDRPDDFRTEILGLMKAQKVKNAIIVPSGAKGGFVVKHLPTSGTRDAIQGEVIRCYEGFINTLLDLTDNIVKESIVRPNNVVCHDDVDTYLVVAADKGTASFSDIANKLSKNHAFWLGDAFASGGSAGYDHKKIGITARGAWESVKRHFHELNIDPLNQDISVIGIGDMSGDVFGNGMLYTKHIKLIAAFDHRHIFIDPTPDPIKTYEERKRLFNLPTSSWEDFNADLISTGGGVFKRSLKSISLTPEMRAALGTNAAQLTPNELIRAILQAPVDLFFNGGIGTYVKSRTESHAEVGDRTNEYCRINGDELRCRVVGEGGNLGFTQLGRVEYALKGGFINTDFIDNSAGVDCSDHEVNLKILLNQDVQAGKMTESERNTLLASLTNEVAALVLKDNEDQALVMSFTAHHAAKNVGLHQQYLHTLEAANEINREVEFLPDDKTILERKAAGLGLTRPELAVLLAYTKILIKQDILETQLPDDINLSRIVETAFPPAIRERYKYLMKGHKLYRDIVATQLSNKVVNEMGITFVYRMRMESGASISNIIHAYTISSAVFNAAELRRLIESLGVKVPLATQYEMLFHIRTLMSLSTRWFLQSRHLDADLEKVIAHFSQGIQKLKELIPRLMGGETKNYLTKLYESFHQQGLPMETAKTIATYRAIYTTLNIIEVASRHGFDLEQTAQVYFLAGEKMNLLWFRDQIAKDTRDGHWNALARLTLRDELDISQRALTIAVIKSSYDETHPELLVKGWISRNEAAIQRWDQLLAMLHASTDIDYTMFFIAIRELLGLITNSMHKQGVLSEM